MKYIFQCRISDWKRFNRYLYKYWKLQSSVIILSLVSTPLTLAIPYLTKFIIDKAYGNKDLRLFLILAIIGAVVYILNSFINSLSNYFSERINGNIRFDITKDLFRHFQNLPLSFFKDRSTGEHIYEIGADVNKVSYFISKVTPQLVALLPRLIFIVVIVFYLNWKLALLATLMIPISYIHPYIFGKWLKEISRQTIEKAEDMFTILHETFTHTHLIKAFGKEAHQINGLEENIAKEKDFQLKNVKLLNISSFSGSVLDRVLIGIITLFGGYQIIKGTMTLGSLTAIMIYLTQLISIMQSLGNFYENAAINSVSLERLSDIMDIESEIKDSENAMSYQILKGEIKFKGISFGYKKNKLVLKDINLSIEPASKIAIVGLSGCGKTTLFSLILRLYELEKGSVLIDGRDIKDIKLNSLKEQIGIALQEPFLWNESVAFNILYGKVGWSHEDMIMAAKIAEAHEFIMNLPKQYDSIIGEMACKISEGQKQKIAIARAVIKKPKILILDEAMSSIDSETEDMIVDNIKRKFNDSTIILTSHRLSSVRKMDLVYFLESASQIDIGRHEDLMTQNPRYRNMFSGQIQEEKLKSGELLNKPVAEGFCLG